MNASARLPANSATCSVRRVVNTSLNPSESYHCSSVISQTTGLAKKKIRRATANSATPIQKRRGGRGIRSSRPSSGPPRSNGSNGRYRRVICLRSLDRSQSEVVGAEIGVAGGRRIVEVPADGCPQRLDRIRRRPAKKGSGSLRARRDVLGHGSSRLEVIGQELVGDLHQLRARSGGLEDHPRPHRHREGAVLTQVEGAALSRG